MLGEKIMRKEVREVKNIKNRKDAQMMKCEKEIQDEGNERKKLKERIGLSNDKLAGEGRSADVKW